MYIDCSLNFASSHYIHIMKNFLESIKSRDPAAKSILSIILLIEEKQLCTAFQNEIKTLR